MANRQLTATLVSTVKLKSRLPSSQTDISDAEILTIATEEMLGYLVPNILSANANYFKRPNDVTLVSGTTSYEIPSQSIGGKLASVMLVEDNDTERKVPIVEYDEDAARGGIADGFALTVGYVRNHRLHLTPEPTGATTLRMIFYCRPGDLVDSAGSDTTTIATVTNSTTATITGAVTGLVTGASFDIIGVDNPFPCLGTYTATVSGTNLSSISPGMDTEVASGDYIALKGNSPIPQIPYDLHPVLVERTTARILALLGDTNGMQLTLDRAATMEEQALRLISPRVDDTTHKVVNTDGPRFIWNRGRYPWPGT